MKTKFEKGNIYINKRTMLIVKCTRDSIQGSYYFEGVVVEQGSSRYPSGHRDFSWNTRAFILYQEETIQEPQLNVIL